MTVTFDPSTDFETVVDGAAAVTLNRRGSSDNVSIATALRRNLSTSEIVASDGRLRSGDTRWHFSAAEVSTSSPPRMGDWIVPSDGTRFQILEVRRDTLSNRWRCVTRDLRVAYGLDDTITIEEASYAKGTAGAQEATYSTHQTGIRGRIQEVDAEAGTTAGARRTERRFAVMLEADLELGTQHRLKDREGKLYRVVAVTGRASLGEPMTIEATEWR